MIAPAKSPSSPVRADFPEGPWGWSPCQPPSPTFRSLLPGLPTASTHVWRSQPGLALLSSGHLVRRASGNSSQWETRSTVIAWIRFPGNTKAARKPRVPSSTDSALSTEVQGESRVSLTLFDSLPLRGRQAALRYSFPNCESVCRSMPSSS